MLTGGMDPRTWFATAANGFLHLVDGVPPTMLGAPGLGVWDVRSLLGHASRSFLTIESYVRPGRTGPVGLSSPAEYYIAIRDKLADMAEVAERGRQAGLALGPHPSSAVHAIARVVMPLVDSTPDDCLVETPFGTMTLAGYLPTRAFELTVHGIDLARATGQYLPEELVECTVPALDLGVAMASPAQRVTLLLAVTGRDPLPADFTVI